MVSYRAGDRIVGTAAERAALSGNNISPVAQTSWKIIARGVVSGGTSSNADGLDTGTGNSSGNNQVITVNTLYSSPPDNIQFLFHGVKPDSNSKDPQMNFGKDTIEFNNIKYRNRQIHSNSNSAYGSQVDTDTLRGMNLHNEIGEHGIWHGFISNIASQPKNFSFFAMNAEDSPSNGLVPTSMGGMVQGSGTWRGGDGSGDQYTNKLNRITFHRKPGYYWAEDTEFVILGCDNNESDNETRGDTFWNLIGETKLTTAGALAASFTAKKWLMFEAFVAPSAAQTVGVFFNDTTSADYCLKTSKDRVPYNDNSYSRFSKKTIYLNGMDNDTEFFWIKGIIDNRTDYAKLVTMESISMGNYGATEPNHTYTAGKWADTAQANKINFGDTEAVDTDYQAGSWVRVWGND